MLRGFYANHVFALVRVPPDEGLCFTYIRDEARRAKQRSVTPQKGECQEDILFNVMNPLTNQTVEAKVSFILNKGCSVDHKKIPLSIFNMLIVKNNQIKKLFQRGAKL